MRTDAEVQRAAEMTADLTLRLVAAKRERDRARSIAVALEAQVARVEALAAAWDDPSRLDACRFLHLSDRASDIRAALNPEPTP